MCGHKIERQIDQCRALLNRIRQRQEIFESNWTQPVPGSEIVGSAELKKREHENNNNNNGKKLFLFLSQPTFRVPFTFTSSPLSESLKQAKLNHTKCSTLRASPSVVFLSDEETRKVSQNRVKLLRSPQPKLLNYSILFLPVNQVYSSASIR